MRRLVCLLLCVLLLTACGTGGTESSASASGSSAGASASSSSSEGGQEPAANTPFTLAAAPSYSFHPVLAESTINLTLAPLMYEGLFTLDSTFQAQPLLCQNYVVSSDGLTWTFTLQTGITFSDGTPLTGEVAAQALQTARDPASRYAARLSSVSSIQGTGNQVVITLSQPNGALPQLLDIPISLGTGDRPLGTGPYVLTDQNGTLSLTARSDWRLGVENLPLQEIALSSTARTDDLMPAFNAGEISLLDVDLTGNSALGSSGRYQVWDYNTTSMLYLGFNAQQGLCRDAAVRKAIAQAIDRDDVADSIFARHAKAAALPVHPDSPWYDGELAAELAYDPSVLADLSLDGRPLTLVVNIEDTAKSAAATYIAQQLEAAGLVVTVDRQPALHSPQRPGGGQSHRCRRPVPAPLPAGPHRPHLFSERHRPHPVRPGGRALAGVRQHIFPVGPLDHPRIGHPEQNRHPKEITARSVRAGPPQAARRKKDEWI